MSSPFQLSVVAAMHYQELPMHERVQKIADKGLWAELWYWHRPEDELEKVIETGVPIVSMTGYLDGNLTDDVEIEKFLETAEQSAEKAKLFKNRRPNLNFHGTGLGMDGLPKKPVTKVTGEMWAKAALTLNKLAALGEKHDVTYVLENLNLPVDHPGTPFNSPHDTLALVRAVDSPHLKLNLDLYHTQLGDGNLIGTIKECLPYIGEIQVADAPGRCEPGTGEVNYRNVAYALAEMGYDGIVSLGGWPKTDSDSAIDTSVATFSDL